MIGRSMRSPPPPLAALQASLGDAYAQVLGAATDCALLDFPDHSNVGDSAIWLGQIALLKRAGVRIRYAASRGDFSLPALRRNLPPGGIVLIHGGGNFGTLYPAHQEHREMLLRDCAGLKVVQLPQSICYDDADALQRTARAIAAHREFTLMVRDQASYRIATGALGACARLCPDAALMLVGSLARPQPRVDCFILARTDKERSSDGLASAVVHHAEGLDILCGDWLEEPASARLAWAQWVRPKLRRASLRMAPWQRLVTASYTSAARVRVQRGVRLLGRGKVVITDRLHGMILSVAAGIPCVALDNSNGKVSAFHRLWLGGVPGCALAASVPDAVAMARSFIADAASPQRRNEAAPSGFP